MSDIPMIRVVNARTHNLRGIDVELPRDKLVVVTGVSGSGKSSLAFDTLYAEGQRRYVESLSAYARQYLDQMAKPEVDRIDGLTPAIAIDQRAAAPNPRSTIATLTEIHDHLRVLFAAAGTPHDPETGEPLLRMGTADILAALMAAPEGSRMILLSPLEMDDERRSAASLLDELKRQGFIRVRLGGELRDLDELADTALHGEEFDVVIDRLVRRDGIESRLADSIETARRWSPHRILCLVEEPGAAAPGLRVFPTSFTNPVTGFTLPVPRPRHFSFNSPQGACPVCQGLGRVADGAGEEGVEKAVCPECGGSRLQRWQRAVRFGARAGGGNRGLALHEITALSVDDALDWARGVIDDDGLVPAHLMPLPTGIRHRLEFLRHVGLGYLTLDREAATLSGGEFQRVRLATQIGSGLSGVLYVLDEPSIGLHPRDNKDLLQALCRLRALGNTVVVVEHDLDTMRAADHLIEIGPGPGHRGGRLLFSGPPARLTADAAPDSPTRPWLDGSAAVKHPPRREVPPLDSAALAKGRASAGWLSLLGASGHNLRNVDLHIPLGRLVAVAGVSGSGKSTLIHDTLLPALNRALGNSGPAPLAYRALLGAAAIHKVIAMDQSPPGRTHRSNPVTYLGAFDVIRRLFSQTPASRARGFSAARFSFNRPGGRCEACQGQGRLRVDMQFLADAVITCEACHGRRFNRETLEITFKGRDISQVLEMTTDEACVFFGPVSDVARRLRALQRTGLGYLRLGQPLDTLSGGEAQRLKLAAELGRPAPDPALFLLDEPTTGLHPADVAVLLDNLFALRGQGHTVVVVEHHPELLMAADWIIELGPGGGPHGGRILATGTPEEIAATSGSPTAPWLRKKP